MRSPPEVEEFFRELRSDKFSLDTETTSLRVDELELVGISFSDGEISGYIPVGHKSNIDGSLLPGQVNLHWLVSYLNDEVFVDKKKLIAHNFPFDYKVLKINGVDLYSHEWFDTMVAHHLLDENDKHGLKYLVNKFFGDDYGINISNAHLQDVELIGEYACKDAYYTFLLAENFYGELISEGLDKLFFKVEMPFLRAIGEMELEGVLVDWEKVKNITNSLNKELVVLEEGLYRSLGENYKLQTNVFGEVTGVVGRHNFNSSQQLRDIIVNRLKLSINKTTVSGAESTGRESLEALKGSHEFIDLLLKHRAISKLKNAFFDPLPRFKNKDGRVRCSFNDTGARTGRLSCSEPNLQQLPKSSDDVGVDTRGCFIAPKGYKMITCDYSGQELRVLAHITNCEPMIKAFKEGADFHQATADKFGVDRTKAKAINFGVAYGKAQPLDAKILTPFGWTTFGDVKEGDYIFTANGTTTQITKVHPIQKQPTYKLTMRDRSSTECGEEHLWTIQTTYDKQLGKERIISTKELKKILKKGKQNNCFIQYNRPLYFKSKYQYLHPYIMGLYLGDGDNCNRLTIANKDIVKKVKDLLPEGIQLTNNGYAYRMIAPRKTNDKKQFISSNPIINYMREIGLDGRKSGDKFIPKQYLYGDYQQRKQLFYGLFDSDGSFNNNSYDYTTISKCLADDVMFLCKSLGARCTMRERHTYYNGKRGRLSYRLFISFPPVRQSNSIESIEYVGEKNCRCITVEHESGLYITDDFIVTHNSAYGFSQDWGVSEEEAQKFLDDYFSMFPEVKNKIDETTMSVKKNNHATSLTGRKRRFVTNEQGYHPNKNFRQAFNFLIQGFSADMIRIAAIKCLNLIRRNPSWGLRIIFTVHDELGFIVKEEHLEEAVRNIKDCFETAVKLRVPLVADVGVGDNYAEAK